MTDEKNKKKEPDTVRLQAFRELPMDILKSFTKEEVRTFLFEDEWSDTLREKLKGYLVDEK